MRMVLDKNTGGILHAKDYLVLPYIAPVSDLTIKASFLVASDVVCSGKITALFDLVVIGDLTAGELEVKGRLVCMGKCRVNGLMTVQNEIWAGELIAETIEAHDRIVAQEIDGTRISADGSIIVAKTMAVEETARSGRAILCGETAYGAGKVAANTVITGEPIDLDEGEEGLVPPQVYRLAPKPAENGAESSGRGALSADFAPNNDFEGYIDALVGRTDSDTDEIRLLHWRGVLCEAREIVSANRWTRYRNAGMLLWLTEIVHSPYFRDWNSIRGWYTLFLHLFTKLSHNESPEEAQPVPARALFPGDTVLHDKFGRGRVTKVSGFAGGEIAAIDFAEVGAKRVIMTEGTLRHFQIIRRLNASGEERMSNYASSIQCEIKNYAEWIRALQILHLYGAGYDKELFDVIFELVSANLGLKAKFVSDRLFEKGWKTYVQ